MRRRRSSRRGFVLLIVLSLLILSLVIVITFFIVASQFRRAAASSARNGKPASPPRKQLNSAMFQLLRDTRSRGSAVRFHSLLRDAYGEDGCRGRLASSQVLKQVNEQFPIAGTTLPTGASKLSNGQFIDLVIDTASQTLASNDGRPHTLSELPSFYNGCVLTVVSGGVAGCSTRIVGSFPRGSIHILRTLPFRTDRTGDELWAALGDAAFLVNGQVFNGTGVGFRYHDAAQHSIKVAKLDGAIPVSTGGQTVDLPAALLPNHASRPAFAPQQPQAEFVALLNGGSDESYDAADYQNMFMALVNPAAQMSRDILPSFHRPELINYWKHQPSASPGSYWADDNFKRLVSLRPVEPNFDGSNPQYNDVTGPWDVDNDGDGIPDSVWVDLGFPDETAANGRRFRPLFAILCMDLDGRLNVNAHGNPTASYPARPAPAYVAAGTTQGFPKGLGYGPPEIGLSGVINRSDMLFGQRYGMDAVPGIPGLDLLAGIKHFTEPLNYFNSAGQRSAYATPPDLRGELAFGFDVFGQPVSEQIPGSVLDARADSPYEINLIDHPNADAPFTLAELEAVQRRWDLDSPTLPHRLLNLVDLTASENARLVTTDSYDPPVPGIQVPNELRRTFAAAGLPNARNMAELMASRLTPGVDVNAELTKLLSPDLALGLRMDVNRAFGNGQDDNGNGIADEPGEQSAEYVWNQQGSSPRFASPAEFTDVRCYQSNGADVNGDGKIDGQDGLLARQLFARHLYMLMMTVIDHGSAAPDPSVARQVAQWSVNVADFRDADSIMTPFEYAINPFLGWMVDGDPRTNEGPMRDVVWGCERPEVLITETLAFHDRRTEDRNDDNGLKTKTGPNDGEPHDPDFDQRLRPRGTVFIELFNPVTSPTTLRPAELDASPTSAGIDLVKVSSDGLVKSPVWRLLFVKDGAAGKDPDDPNGTITEETRRIYFINPALLGPTVPPLDLSGQGGDFWTTLPVPSLAPGQYSVVGSAGIRQGDDYVSPVGRLATITEADEQDYQSLRIGETRRIVLSPTAAGNQVHVYSNGLTPAAAFQDSAPYPTDPGTLPPGSPDDQDIRPASAIVIDQPRSLNISEPLQGYTNTGFDTSTTLEGFYTPVRDKPLDQDNDLRLMKNQTTTWGMIHLQRLADPTRPHHAAANPYRTIDSHRCDLTAFNGISTSQDPDSAGRTCFYAVQRGDTRTQRELWPQEPFSAADPTQDWSRDPGGTHYFSFYLRSSLGCLNHGFWPFQGAAAGPYRGAPALDIRHSRVFSWLAWNNRPFVSQYELLQVPADQSSQILRNYSLPVGSSPYDTLSPSPQYGQLLNFFHTSPSSQVASARNFHRLFEYVEVPSRYVGADTVLNPAWFGKSNTQMDEPTMNPVVNPRLPDPSKQSCNPSFLPPFNRVSEYRDPGRVNINTLYDRKVWDALLGGFAGCSFESLVASRRGCGGLAGDLIPANLDANFPSCVANPFRPAGSGSLVPLKHLERQDIETTLLRSGAPPPQPTDPNYPKATSPTAAPLLEGGFVAANPVATDPRNSVFRYNVLHRLGNMVTTRSNVYAVWITIGYFEVEPNDANGTVISDAFHGDGCRVAQEIGRETGDIQRHRAFYIIDRSVPVAFEPGENHNVERCILVSRYIE